MDASTVPKSSLIFSQISLDEAREAILQARNTVPGVDKIPTSILKHA